MADEEPTFPEDTSITKYEKARMLGSRALQIAMGAPFLVDLSKIELEKIRFNPIEIAKKEFEEGVIPISVRRLPQRTSRENQEPASAV